MFGKKWIKILASLIAVLLAAVLVIGAVDTAAWFSDTASTEDNVFTAGTLDLALSNTAASGYGDGVTATWSSPTDWAPSETVDATLYFTNKGNINILEMMMDFNIVSRNGQGDGSHLDDVIYISVWEECFNGNCVGTGPTVGHFLPFIEQQCDANADDKLYLSELAACSNFAGSTAPGPVTQDDVYGDGILIEGGNQKDYALHLEFTFDENAGNIYQGDSVVMDIDFEALQEFTYFGNLTGVPHPGW